MQWYAKPVPNLKCDVAAMETVTATQIAQDKLSCRATVYGRNYGGVLDFIR